jgi:hypothetical protein
VVTDLYTPQFVVRSDLVGLTIPNTVHLVSRIGFRTYTRHYEYLQTLPTKMDTQEMEQIMEMLLAMQEK